MSCPHSDVLTLDTCTICKEGPPRTEAPIAQCRSCGADIIWVITQNGAKMPLDPEPSPEGRFVKVRVVRGMGGKTEFHVRSLKNSELEGNTKHLYASHFQTCPFADRHKKL